jgi:hypothetical protein
VSVAASTSAGALATAPVSAGAFASLATFGKGMLETVTSSIPAKESNFLGEYARRVLAKAEVDSDDEDDDAEC